MADVWANSIACHPRATCQIAGCCHLVNSVSWSQSWVTLQGAATGRIQRHVIPEPRITHCRVLSLEKIHCHDSRAKCHITGCSHLAKSMSWSCHIARCNNSIRYIVNRFSPYLFFWFFLMQFGLWRYSCYLYYIIKPQLATARADSCDGCVHLFVCSSVCLSSKCKKNNLRAVVSIDDL